MTTGAILAIVLAAVLLFLTGAYMVFAIVLWVVYRLDGGRYDLLEYLRHM